MIHPLLLNKMIDSLTCIELNGINYLKKSIDTRCNNSEFYIIVINFKIYQFIYFC